MGLFVGIQYVCTAERSYSGDWRCHYFNCCGDVVSSLVDIFCGDAMFHIICIYFFDRFCNLINGFLLNHMMFLMLYHLMFYHYIILLPSCRAFGCESFHPNHSNLTVSTFQDDVIKWNIFRVTGPLCGEFAGHRWIPLTKASDTELWYFLGYATEQTAEQTITTPVIWDTIAPIMTSL